MDWNLKTPSWDLTEFEQEAIPNVDSISGSSSLGGEGLRGYFSVDLKLGQVIDSGNQLRDNFRVPVVPKMAILPSGSTKRARVINSGGHTVSCLVDGCTADLRNCREYHRRHKVCEIHSKTPQVTINSYKQRFCQQCSRFHSLEEFDDGKRSCRKRLDGHNRRRRKPQPEPLSSAGTFISTNQGTRFLAFSTPQVYPTTALANPIWGGTIQANEDTKLYNQHPHSQNRFHESSPRSNRSLMHSTNLELSNQTAREAYACQPLLNTIAASSGSSSSAGSNKMLCDGLSSARVLHSDCALSLLSSSPTQTSSIGLGHMIHPNSAPQTNSLGPCLNYNSLETMESILVPNASDTGMFQMAPRDSETPFYWD